MRVLARDIGRDIVHRQECLCDRVADIARDGVSPFTAESRRDKAEDVEMRHGEGGEDLAVFAVDTLIMTKKFAIL